MIFWSTQVFLCIFIITNNVKYDQNVLLNALTCIYSKLKCNLCWNLCVIHVNKLLITHLCKKTQYQITKLKLQSSTSHVNSLCCTEQTHQNKCTSSKHDKLLSKYNDLRCKVKLLIGHYCKVYFYKHSWRSTFFKHNLYNFYLQECCVCVC